MMRFWSAVAVALVIAGQASALSCMRPDLARSFNEAADDPDRAYVLVTGKLLPNGPLPAPPEPGNGTERAAVSAEMIFEGRIFGQDGVGEADRYPVTVTAICLGPWCGDFPETDAPMATLFQTGPEGLSLLSGPCGGATHPNPTEEQIAALERCIANGRCSLAEAAAFAEK